MHALPVMHLLSIQFLTTMKGRTTDRHMSGFQKEQYIEYLEGQLERFSSFMVGQRKENERFKAIEELLEYQSTLIHTLNNKVELLETQQTQTLHGMGEIDRNSQRIKQHEHQIRRLEERAKYGCDENHHQKQQQQMVSNRLENKVKVLEERVNSHNHQVVHQINEGVSIDELKAMEKKVKKYFNKKIDGLEEAIAKTRSKLRNRSRSRERSQRSRSPIEMSAISQYQIEDHRPTPLHHFVNHQSAKSELSTGSQNTYSSIGGFQPRHPVTHFTPHTHKEEDKPKKRNHGKSKTKSKTKKNKKDKSESKSVSRSVSRSVSQKKDKKNQSQLSISNHSNLSVSVSASGKNRSKTKKHTKSRSKSKSPRPTSNSHDKCKRAPYLQHLKPKDTKKKRVESTSQKCSAKLR